MTSTIESIKPDAVIHHAAWKAVDAAEDEENRSKVDGFIDGFVADDATAGYSSADIPSLMIPNGLEFSIKQ